LRENWYVPRPLQAFCWFLHIHTVCISACRCSNHPVQGVTSIWHYHSICGASAQRLSFSISYRLKSLMQVTQFRESCVNVFVTCNCLNKFTFVVADPTFTSMRHTLAPVKWINDPIQWCRRNRPIFSSTECMFAVKQLLLSGNATAIIRAISRQSRLQLPPPPLFYGSSASQQCQCRIQHALLPWHNHTTNSTLT
jgi:hypothetical protein